MHLRVCVSDYRFTTLFFFFPLRMRSGAALVIFTTCFYCVSVSGERLSICGKCIFYVVMECICIRGLVLKKKKQELRSTLGENKGQHRDLVAHVKEELSTDENTRMCMDEHVHIKGALCRCRAYILRIHSRPLVKPDNSTLPISLHYATLRSTGDHL